jgi:hypothetical protein
VKAIALGSSVSANLHQSARLASPGKYSIAASKSARIRLDSARFNLSIIIVRFQVCEEI